MTHSFSGKDRDTQLGAFEIYLRTGRRDGDRLPPAETKFNPWHDPDDGRFTFAGSGIYSRGGAPKMGTMSHVAKPPATATAQGRMADFARETDALTTDLERGRRRREKILNDPRTVYVVKQGDSLSRIAATRKGLSAADLARLNGISPRSILHIGQKLRVPPQAYLDELQAAWDNGQNLIYYMQTHGGALPPDTLHVPSVRTQIDAEWETISRGNYTYKVDIALRLRWVYGELQLGPVAERSRSAQREAGGKDRQLSDHGGHYIGVRFNGPKDWFNHFAQDANFNRGVYKSIENSWAKDLQAGRKVFVDIVPHYTRLSTRPDSLTVTWYVDGKRSIRKLLNERKGQ